MIPGEYLLERDPIELNAGRPLPRIEVANRGDRPIQVGSHYHFFEVNRALDFDRAAAYGMRLNIPAGTAVRFEPGDDTESSWSRSAAARESRPERAGERRARRSQTWASGRSRPSKSFTMRMKIDRRTYADTTARPTGDRIRLATPISHPQVERDATVYGDEAKFGGGKVIRDGMGQSPPASRRTARSISSSRTRSIVDWHRASSRPTSGFATAASPASARPAIPDVMDGVTPGLVDRRGDRGHRRRRADPDGRRHRRARPLHLPATDPRRVLTRASPRSSAAAPGPATGTNATTCTPGAWHIDRMLQAADTLPMNFGFLGKGNASRAEALREQIHGRRRRAEAARGLGHDAGGDRSVPVAWRTSSTCRWRFTPTR